MSKKLILEIERYIERIVQLIRKRKKREKISTYSLYMVYDKALLLQPID